MMNIKANNKNAGFTLIEMAIVLVIIGLIIGAVLKGQDLIQNARAKKFVNFVRAAEIGQWTYLDRKGAFNGDTDSDGVIDDIDTLEWTGFSNEPETELVLGSFAYDLYWGYENATDPGNPKNFVAVSSRADDTFSADELVFLESLDTAVDGSSNATGGRVVAITSSKISSNGFNTDFAIDTDDSWDDAVTSIVYYFDKK